MTEAQQVVLMLKGMILELTPEGRERFEDAYKRLKEINDSSQEAQFALCLLGAEAAAS